MRSVSNTNKKTLRNFFLIKFFGLWKNASHTVSINEKSKTIDFSCNFLFLWNYRKSV